MKNRIDIDRLLTVLALAIASLFMLWMIWEASADLL